MSSRALLNVGLCHYVSQTLEMDAEYKGNVEATGDDAKYEGNVEATGKDYLAKSTDIMGEIVGHLSSLRLVILL